MFLGPRRAGHRGEMEHRVRTRPVERRGDARGIAEVEEHAAFRRGPAPGRDDLDRTAGGHREHRLAEVPARPGHEQAEAAHLAGAGASSGARVNRRASRKPPASNAATARPITG